jgi:hypothetical protein
VKTQTFDLQILGYTEKPSVVSLTLEECRAKVFTSNKNEENVRIYQEIGA